MTPLTTLSKSNQITFKKATQMKTKQIAIILVFALFYGNTGITQSKSDKLYYESDIINFIATKEKTGEEVLRKPMGKNVLIIYDTIFKSYTISSLNEDGKTEFFSFKYKPEFKESEIQNVKKMEDSYGNTWYIIDQLNSVGRLKILDARLRKDGLVAWFIIENAKLSVVKVN